MDADFLLHRLDVHSVQPAVKHYSSSAGQKLCKKERNKSPLGYIQHQEECGREENDNLPQKREEEGIYAATQRLKRGGENKADRSHRESQCSSSKGGDSQIQRQCTGMETISEQGCTTEPEKQSTQKGGCSGGFQTETDGLRNAAFFFGAVIKTDNGDHSVADAENRHKDKILKFEIDTQDPDCGFTPQVQNRV